MSMMMNIKISFLIPFFHEYIFVCIQLYIILKLTEKTALNR